MPRKSRSRSSPGGRQAWGSDMRVPQSYEFRKSEEGFLVRDPVDFTDNGKCRDCGNCCGNIIPITKKDVERIKRYIIDHRIKPSKPIFLKGPFARPTIHNECPFLLDQDDHRCSIYPVRPAVCRIYTCHKNYEKELDSEDMKVLADGGFDLMNRNMYATFFPDEFAKELKAHLIPHKHEGGN